MLKDFKSEIKLFVLVGIVAIIVSVGGVFLLREMTPTPVEQPMVAGEKIDTSNWQTYRNDEFGFEVKYPEQWKLATGPDARQLPFTISIKEGYQGMLDIDRFPSVNQAQTIERFKQGKSNVREVSVGGERGVESGGILCEVARPCVVRLDYESNKLAQAGFRFFLVVESTDDSQGIDFFTDPYQLFSSEIKIVHEVLSTFRFMEGGTVKNTITVESPNGGEVWQIGKTYKIEWNQTWGSDVDLWLEDWSSIPVKTFSIAKAVVSPYFWVIPPTMEPGTKYKVRMRVCHECKGATIAGGSEGFFTITNQNEKSVWGDCTFRDRGRLSEKDNALNVHPEGVDLKRIHIKFKEGTQVRLRNNSFVSMCGADLSGVNELVRTNFLTLERLFSRSEEDLQEDFDRLVAKDPNIADLNLWYRIRLAEDTDFQKLVKFVQQFNEFDLVEIAYPQSKAVPLPTP